MSTFELRYAGGPTSVITYGGLRLLTDPTFDPPGEYPIGQRTLTKTADAAFGLADAGTLDAVLLSHDQHPDNLDRSGHDALKAARLVLSTASAAERLGGSVRALPNWEAVEVGAVRITGVPAQHGPDGSLPYVGEVTGFVLEGEGLPKVYVSGDNASLDVVRTIASRLGPFDIAVLFAGAAQTPLIPDAHLTLTSDLAAEAADILGARHVVPLHFEHWAHFTQGPETLTDAFVRAGNADRLHLLKPGEEITL